MTNAMISIVMPAYNEGHNIREIVECVTPYGDEVIVIDDGNTDYTSNLAASAGARVVRIEKNLGHVNAIKEGFANARGDIIVSFDADGEFPLDKIPWLVSPIKQIKADLVQGRRNVIPRLSEKLVNNLANRIDWVGDSCSGFEAIRSNIARELKIHGVRICGILNLEFVAAGERLVEIPITLNHINKPRKFAWFHHKQFFYILPWFLNRKRSPKPIIWRNI